MSLQPTISHKRVYVITLLFQEIYYLRSEFWSQFKVTLLILLTSSFHDHYEYGTSCENSKYQSCEFQVSVKSQSRIMNQQLPSILYQQFLILKKCIFPPPSLYVPSSALPPLYVSSSALPSLYLLHFQRKICGFTYI